MTTRPVQAHNRALVLLILGAFVCTITPGAFAADAPVRLAILSGDGDRAPAEEVIAQLEVALTENKEIALLERAQVRKILAEQNLSAAGLTDPATAAKMGKLLSVEMFLFVERMPKVSPPTCRVQMVETESGMVLAADIVEERALGQNRSPVRDLLSTAMAKARVPLAKRKYVAILELRNEQPTRSLDTVAIAATMLLTTDLGRLPDVVVLERERLDRLTAEDSLAGAQLALKASSTLIAGRVRRAADPPRLVFDLELRAPGKAAGTKLTVETPVEDIVQMRRALLEAITQALGASGLADGQPDRRTEAMAFAALARPLAFYGDCAEATRAGETAYALWPSNETRYAAFEAWYHYQFWCNTHDPRSEETQRLALKAAIRRCTLCLDQSRANGKPVNVGIGQAGMAPCPQDYAPARRMATPELQELQDGLRAVSQEIARLQLAYLREHYSDPPDHEFALIGGTLIQRQYWALIQMMNAINFEERGVDDDHFAAMDACLRAFLNPPDPTPPNCEEWIESISWLPWGMQMFYRSNPRGNDDEARARYVALWREWRKNAHPLVRIVGCEAAIILDDDGHGAAREMLETFLKEYPTESPARTSRTDYGIFVHMMDLPLGRLGADDKGDYSRRLCEPWLKARDAVRLVCWNQALYQWLQALDSQQRYAEADALCGQAIGIMQAGDWSKEDRSAEAGSIIARLTQRRRAYASKTGAAPAEPWAEFNIAPLPFGLKGEVNKSLVAGDLLFCAGQTLDEVGYTYCVGAWKLPGGEALNPPETLLVPSKDWFEYPVTGLAWSGESLYVSTPLGLLEYKPGGKLQLLGEANGVPGTDLTAVAWCGGKLYLGIGSRVYGKFGLATFDPATGKGEMLTSSGATEKKSALDGIRHLIQSLLPDPSGKALWLSIRECDERGVWRYKPDTGEMDYVVKEEWFPQGALSWCADGLLYSIEPGIVLFKPETHEKIWLMGTYSARHNPLGIAGKPLMTYPSQVYLPAFYDGALLMARTNTDGRLRLFAPGQDDSPQEQLSYIIGLHDTTNGIVAVSSGGRAFLIKKRQ